MQTELRYERRFLPLLVPLGLGPGYSEVRVGRDTACEDGWAFDAHIPLASITGAEATSAVFAGGVHYGGRWWSMDRGRAWWH